jgi:acyl CoA:acetate/3-ketoacid CoA transferase
VIVEVEEIVEAGQLDPDEVHTPGIFVDYLFKGEEFKHKFEKLVYDPAYAPPSTAPKGGK